LTNKYELAVLYHPDLEIDLEKAAEKVANIVKANGGTIVSEDNGAKEHLPIKLRVTTTLFMYFTWQKFQPRVLET
jgi:ribosomal protein S6